jgi:hypothetical protein
MSFEFWVSSSKRNPDRAGGFLLLRGKTKPLFTRGVLLGTLNLARETVLYHFAHKRYKLPPLLPDKEFETQWLVKWKQKVVPDHGI